MYYMTNLENTKNIKNNSNALRKDWENGSEKLAQQFREYVLLHWNAQENQVF